MRFLRALLMLGVVLNANAQQAKNSAKLPDGPGKELVVKLCSGCHELELVVTRPRTKTGWEENIEDMVARGSKGTDAELDSVVAYLTTHFGRLNINTATAAEMQTALGFTEDEAKAVASYRQARGKIADFDQLKTVKGLDAAKLKAQRASIAFDR